MTKKQRWALIKHVRSVMKSKRIELRTRVAHNIKAIYIQAKIAMKRQKFEVIQLAD